MKINVRTYFISLILLEFFMSIGTEAKAIEPDSVDDSDMKTLELEPAVELPRKLFADMLAKGHFFQDIFSEQSTPHKIQFGHVCENPNEWEQRFEQKDLKNNNHQGKVRWGNKNGGYGEHYWDLNHGTANTDEEDEEV